MHENREISNTPWSDDQGRSAKAINHNADAHVLEKSDCAVIPVNQPNKEGQPSAEVGEGRAQPKENIVQSRMLPAQSGKRRSEEVGLCRNTCEPAEQGRATFCGGWGGKGTAEGEHRSVTHAPGTERETHVPGTGRCA